MRSFFLVSKENTVFYVGQQKSFMNINYAKHKNANMRLSRILMDILEYVAVKET